MKVDVSFFDGEWTRNYLFGTMKKNYAVMKTKNQTMYKMEYPQKILEKITIPMVLILHGINMIKQQGCQFQKQIKISVIKCLCGVLAKLKKVSAFL